MNYIVKFERKNGSVGEDTVTAESKSAAIRDFKEIYRHGEVKIMDVREDKVITKADERNALEKIKKIVEVLGKDSYVAAAFDGAFELAEQNIEFDAAFGAKFYIEEYNKTSARERELKEEYERKLEERNQDLKDMTEKLRNAYEVANERQRQINDLLKKLEDMTKLSAENYTASVESERKLAEAQEEIIRLKAKLYDLLMAKETL